MGINPTGYHSRALRTFLMGWGIAGFKDDDHLPEVIEARENVRNMYSFITSISPGLNDNQYAAQQIVDIYFHEYVRMKYGKSEQ